MRNYKMIIYPAAAIALQLFWFTAVNLISWSWISHGRAVRDILFLNISLNMVFEIILVVIMSFIIKNSLNKRLDRINTFLCGTMEDGLAQTLETQEKDFLHLLHININSLVTKFRNLASQVNGMNDKIAHFTDELDDKAAKINLSNRETAEAINEIARCMEDQVGAIKDAENYSVEAVEVAHKAVGSSQALRYQGSLTIETVEASCSNFSVFIEKLEQSAQISNKAVERIKKLEDQTMLIQTIADQVSGISQSTNLLALNASIEAARAGEAGKGFAVVASEVKKLAEDSTKQSKQIQEIIEGVKAEINTVVCSMEEEISLIKEYIGFSQMTRDDLEKTNVEVKEINAAIDEIGGAVFAQIDSITKVTKIIESTSAAFDNIAASTEEIAASTEEQANVAEETFKQVAGLLDMSKGIAAC